VIEVYLLYMVLKLINIVNKYDMDKYVHRNVFTVQTWFYGIVPLRFSLYWLY